MIPGSNLLNQALSILGKQSFQYYAFASRTPNSVGQDVTAYAAPLCLQGSVQPVPRELFERYGLDLQGNYVNVYVSKNVLDVTRDVSGDVIAFNGKTYQCVSETPWAAVDGWDAVLCVQVPSPL